MKAVAKNLMNSKKATKKSDEKKPLVTSDANQNYGNQNRSRNSSGSSPPHMRRSLSHSSNSSISEMPMVSIRSGSHPSSPTALKEQVPAAMDIDFDQVPFQFYSREAVSWKSGFMQALILILICLLVPCIFVLIAMIICLIRFKYKPSMKAEEKQKEFNVYLMLFGITATKDSIIITLALHVVYNSPASNYEIGYSPLVFFWCMVLFLFPLAAFQIAEVKYIFGFNSDKKNLLKLFKQLSSKAKQFEFKKVDDQEKYFSDKYKDLSSIKSSSDELSFLMRWTSKPLLIASAIIAVMTCLIHCIIPLLLQIMDCFACRDVMHYYHIANGTNGTNVTVNVTLPVDTYKAVIAMSAINSLIVSLFSSAYFIFVILWKISMLNEWKRFNATESDTTTTLVNSGPQGIAMWWKIRQTLKLYSTSNLCMSVLITKMACVVALVVISGLSTTLFYTTRSLESHFYAHNAIPLLIDNLLLYFALVFMGVLSFLIDREKTHSGRIIEIKQLNVGFELGRLMNLEQETVESEPGVRVKVRVMRGCLMLLQELTSTMENLEKSTSSKLVLVCFCLATILILPSTFMTFRYIYSRI